MPSFRKAANQAQHVLQSHQAIGRSRHVDKHVQNGERQIHSLGTARNYQQALQGAAKWLQARRMGTLKTLTPEDAKQYLEERSEHVQQKTLNQDRQALQVCLQQKLPVVRSKVSGTVEGRAYSEPQMKLIAASQNPENQLATELAFEAGLRAHELLTIRPAEEQPRSTHRQWFKELFNEVRGKKYSVIGKGGLVREVVISNELAEKLEAARLEKPIQRTDRGIHYEQHYNIGGGKSWSNSFGRSSKRTLNWSKGAHGLRHSFAQRKMKTFQQAGMTYQEALGVVSQLLGHFRPDITEVYLR